MISTTGLAAFALIALGMVLSPGPNMIVTQRWATASVLTALAVQVATDRRQG